MQVLDRLGKGEPQVDIGADLMLPTSAICTILKNKDKIKSSATTSTEFPAKKFTSSRYYSVEEMDKLLSIWIDDKLKCNMPLCKAIIMDKARRIYSHIQSQTADVIESFSVSRGWFDRFKNRNKLYNIKITEEAASSGTKAAASFPSNLK
ncbi:putative CENPB DNA-binding domain-containing protein 1 [Discoglossus pictus]